MSGKDSLPTIAGDTNKETVKACERHHYFAHPLAASPQPLLPAVAPATHPTPRHNHPKCQGAIPVITTPSTIVDKLIVLEGLDNPH